MDDSFIRQGYELILQYWGQRGQGFIMFHVVSSYLWPMGCIMCMLLASLVVNEHLRGSKTDPCQKKLIQKTNLAAKKEWDQLIPSDPVRSIKSVLV